MKSFKSTQEFQNPQSNEKLTLIATTNNSEKITLIGKNKQTNKQNKLILIATKQNHLKKENASILT